MLTHLFFFALMSFRLYRSRACTFYCSWLSRTSQIYPKRSVDRVRQGLGYEGIGDPIKRVQLRFPYVVTPFLLTGLHEYSAWVRGGIGLLKSIQSVALIVSAGT